MSQPDDTCPMIDKIIDRVDSIRDMIRGYESIDDADELRERLSDVEQVLFWYSVEDDLNEIRRHVASIRMWGQEWKDRAKSLAEELSSAGLAQ